MTAFTRVREDMLGRQRHPADDNATDRVVVSPLSGPVVYFDRSLRVHATAGSIAPDSIVDIGNFYANAYAEPSVTGE